MNATLANMPTLLRSAIASRVSFVHVPHIKLKAEHQALVLFHIVEIGLAYWEGWRDAKKTREGDAERETSRRKGKEKGKGRGRGVVGKGKYTVVFR
jgi:hypothetical protein